ncbi:MAG: lambda-exonuclease family protein [Rhodoferax sp.]
MNAVLKSIVNEPTIVQLAQGSPEWLAYRRTMRNASESAAVLGLSPWQTPYQLWLAKTGRSEVKVTAPMRRGTELEPAARLAYEEQTGLVMQPLVLQRQLDDQPYSASLDGMTLGGDLVLEVKCPFQGQLSKLWQLAASGEVPLHYQVQVQHQLMVSGAQQAHFWVFGDGQGVLVEVRADEALMERIRRGWEGFQVFMDSDSPPPLVEGDTRHREDAAWLEAASAYSLAKRQADEAAEVLDEARKALVLLAEHPKEQGAGVSVTRFWKQGSVNYKAVAELKGVDLEAYRGKAREEVRVSETT